MDNFQQRKFKIGEGRGSSLSGGVITIRDPALLPFGAFSVMNNVKKWHPGIQKRRGMIALHSDELLPGAEFEFNPTLDGDMRSFSNVSWSAARNAAAGTLVDTTGTATEVRAIEPVPGAGLLHRAWLDFSGVTFPAGPIFGVKITCYSNTPLVLSGNMTIVETTKSFGSLVGTDWPLWTGPNLADSTLMETLGVEGTPAEIELNAAGIAYFDTVVRGSGQAALMMMDYDFDYLDVPTATVDSRYTFRTVEYFNAAWHPTLTVTMAL